MQRIATVLILLFVAVTPVFGQNLLENPGFDVPDQLDGWTCTSNHGLASWSSEDRLGSPGSGSVQYDVTATSNNSSIWCAQCIPVNELRTYVVSGWHLWPDDPDVSQLGTTRLSIYYYAGADCTSFLEVGATEVGQHPTLDTWYSIETDESIAPAGAMSAIAYFITWQNEANQPVRMRMDDLKVVSILFNDDFESGDISAWSGSTP